jgi:hypothetical protein
MYAPLRRLSVKVAFRPGATFWVRSAAKPGPSIVRPWRRRPLLAITNVVWPASRLPCETTSDLSVSVTDTFAAAA